MAGHSKWHNIKHRKAAVDKKRGKYWSKCSRAIIAAARHGGPAPESNLALRYAIDEARYANMPRDTIERAIKKGAGEIGGAEWEPVRYEGYGPGGVALLIDGLTDNRTRTVGDLRLVMGKHGGNLGAAGSVAYLFEPRGEVVIAAEGASEETVMGAAIEAGADDVEAPESSEGVWTVTTAPGAFQPVKESLEKAGLKIEQAGLTMAPTTRVTIRGEEARRLLALIESVEDLDDVQKVYSNADIPAEELADLAG
ncbi:MAG: YebC/PmpR family DNA-binding transcriptional regulator [Phycisphaerales bacterium]